MKFRSFSLDKLLNLHKSYMMPTSNLASTKVVSNSCNVCSSADFMMKEVERFQSFYRDLLRLHELLENIENITTRRQFREVINRIEGKMLFCNYLPQLAHLWCLVDRMILDTNLKV